MQDISQFYSSPVATAVKAVLLTDSDGNNSTVTLLSHARNQGIYKAVASGSGDLSFYMNYDGPFINTNFSGTLSESGDGEIREYKYLNARILNPSGQAVHDAVLTSNTTMYNGNGAIVTSVNTSATGYPLSLIAVPDYVRTSTGSTQIYSDVTATKDGKTDSEVVNPDSTWYSADVSSLSGPEIVLVLDVEGTGDTETPTFTVTTFIVSSFVATTLVIASFLNRRRNK